MSKIKKTKKTIEEDYYEPRYHHFKSRGPYPYSLLFGYENEVELSNTEDSLTDNAEKIINQYPFLYAKNDASLNMGCEFNTHPFNMNWFLKRNKIQYIRKLIAEGFRAKRTCGFHVHLSRNYFTVNHQLKMVKMFYGYPNFIARVSQRSAMFYCKSKIARDVRRWIAYRDDSVITPIDMKTLSGCKNVIEYQNDEYVKYVALNFLPKKSIEVRIFQGTVNKKLILAYLEFCLSVTLFTKDETFDKVTPNGLRKYVMKNRKHYKHLIASGILGRKAKREYSWKIAA
jgi:hypothetical protein